MAGMTVEDAQELAKKVKFECGCRVSVVPVDTESGLELQIHWHACSEPEHEEMGQYELAQVCAENDILLEVKLEGSILTIPPLSDTSTPERWADYVVRGVRKHWRMRGRKKKCGVYCATEERADAVRAQFTEFELAWVDIHLMGRGPEAL